MATGEPYYPGSNGGMEPPVGTGEPSGCRENVCGCILSAGESITYAIDRLTALLADRLKGPCDDIDNCIDKIIKKLEEKYNKGQASCEECKALAEQGMAGTIEYAVRCAGLFCDETVKECSLGSPETWGKPCTGCGEECCRCEMGYCVPEPCPEDDKEHKFYGWCDRNTGLIAVTRDDEPQPGPNFYPVAFEESEQTAAEVAARNCGKEIKLPTGIIPPAPRSSLDFPFCELNQFKTGEAMSRIAAFGTQINRPGAIAEAGAAIAKIGFDGINLGNAGEAIFGIINSIFGFSPAMVSTLAPMLADALGCRRGDVPSLMTTLATFGIAERYIGLDLSEYTVPYRYALNAQCRQKHISPDQAMMAYLANVISDNDLDTLWGIQGICPEDVKWSINASRSKPVPLQLAQMRRRKIISQSDYDRKMREVGYLERGTRDDLFKLTEQLPTLSDIIRFMVRDADDESINGPVKKFNLDAEFGNKYQKQLKEWSEAQGIPEKVAQYAWRSHWTIPSPTQLFNFWHRLRLDPAYPTLFADIQTALIQQDILPYWHKHFFETSYLPLGRVDIRRSYNIGTMTDAELFPAYVRLGYSDADANRLVKFAQRLRREALASHRAIALWKRFGLTRIEAEDRLTADSFTPTEIARAFDDVEHTFITSPYSASFVQGRLPRAELITNLTLHGVSVAAANRIADLLAVKIVHHPAFNEYIIGTKDRATAHADAVTYGLIPAIVDSVLIEADQKIEHGFVGNCIRGIKRRFLLGELDKMQASNILQGRGLTLTRSNRLVDWWGCEQSSNGKAIAAAKLCDWLSRGIITPVDFQQRLERIGYDAIDASRIVNDCLISINTKLLAQAKKDAKEQAAESIRQAKVVAKAEALEQRELVKQIRTNNQRAATRIRREKQLISAAEKMAKKCDCEIYTAIQTVKSEQQRIATQYGLDIDETLQALLLASEQWEGGTPDTYSVIVSSVAELAASPGIAPPIDESTGLPIIGGPIQPSD